MTSQIYNVTLDKIGWAVSDSTMNAACSHPNESVGYDLSGGTVYNSQKILQSNNDLESYRCLICKLILRNPIQITTCGCRYCSACIHRYITKCSADELACVADGTSFSKNEIRRDNGCRIDLSQLIVECSSPCCGWSGRVDYFNEHLLLCPHATIFCPTECGTEITRLQLENHLMKCTKRQLTCEHCDLPFKADALESHILTCPEKATSCQFCKMSISHLRKMGQHLEVCDEILTSCPLLCPFRGNKADVNKHIGNSHQSEMCNSIAQIMQGVLDLRKSKEQLMLRLEQRDKQIDEMEKRLDEVQRAVDRRAESNVLSTTADRLEHANGVDLRSSFAECGSSLTLLRQNFQDVCGVITTMGKRLDEAEMRLDVSEVQTTDGTILWGINDIRRMRTSALASKVVRLSSPPFYTSKYGYKVRVCIYLNGNGAGENTHISLYFILMKSIYDSLIRYPFRQNVQLTIVNQVNAARSITNRFRPVADSACFQKPKTDQNEASGFPRFCSLKVLQDQEFTMGDVLHVSMKVCLDGLDPVLSPYSHP